MATDRLQERVESLELRMDHLEQLPARVTALEVQILQFREEVRGEFSAVRQDIRAQGDELRREMKAQRDELVTHMQVLHEEVLSRISLLGERFPAKGRKRSRNA